MGSGGIHVPGGGGAGGLTRDDLWRQYEIHVGLYKHYLDLTIKFNAFYYALAGAIASFVLSRSDLQTVRFVLILPAAMGIVLAGICIRGAWLNRVSRDDVVKIMQALGFDAWPELHVLSMILVVSAALFALVAIGLSSVVFWPTLLPAGVLCR